MNKKTFEGWELVKALKEKKFKEGTKFKDEFENEYTVTLIPSIPLEFSLKCNHTADGSTHARQLINRTFTLIEPKLYYFNQVRKMDKRIRVKGWKGSFTLCEALNMFEIKCYSKKQINDCFDKKVWEIEE